MLSKYRILLAVFILNFAAAATSTTLLAKTVKIKVVTQGAATPAGPHRIANHVVRLNMDDGSILQEPITSESLEPGDASAKWVGPGAVFEVSLFEERRNGSYRLSLLGRSSHNPSTRGQFYYLFDLEVPTVGAATASGCHHRYPSYEIFIDDKKIYNFSVAEATADDPAGCSISVHGGNQQVGQAALPVRRGVSLPQACQAANIQELKKRCRMSVKDVEGTIAYGDQLRKRADLKAKEAIEPGFQCIEGGAKLLTSLFTDCNPKSGQTNLLECSKSLAEIPSIYEDCSTAISLLLEADRLYQLAEEFYGSAAVAFADQGGYEIMMALRECGETKCYETATTLMANADRQKKNVTREREKIRKEIERLKQIRSQLGTCRKDKTKCARPPAEQRPGPALKLD